MRMLKPKLLKMKWRMHKTTKGEMAVRGKRAIGEPEL